MCSFIINCIFKKNIAISLFGARTDTKDNLSVRIPVKITAKQICLIEQVTKMIDVSIL